MTVNNTKLLQYIYINFVSQTRSVSLSLFHLKFPLIESQYVVAIVVMQKGYNSMMVTQEDTLH